MIDPKTIDLLNKATIFSIIKSNAFETIPISSNKLFWHFIPFHLNSKPNLNGKLHLFCFLKHPLEPYKKKG